MKLLVLAIWLLPSAALAANGAACRITPPSTVETGSTTTNTAASCVDVCDYSGDPSGIEGALVCGPVWMPLQNADSATFKVIADTATCAFDTVDIVEWDSSTAPAAGQALKVLGTLDDDGTGGSCGGSPCYAVDVPYPISGYVYIHSNATTVGGAACASFKIRMKQGK